MYDYNDCNCVIDHRSKKEWTICAEHFSNIGGLSTLCNLWLCAVLCAFGASGITIIWHTGWVAGVDPSIIAWVFVEHTVAAWLPTISLWVSFLRSQYWCNHGPSNRSNGYY